MGDAVDQDPCDWSTVWPPGMTPPSSAADVEDLLTRMDAADAEATLARARQAFHDLDSPNDVQQQEEQVCKEAERIRAFADLAAPCGCKVESYNHGGWFGRVDNQLAIIYAPKKTRCTDVGLVYNFVDARDEHQNDIKDEHQNDIKDFEECGDGSSRTSMPSTSPASDKATSKSSTSRKANRNWR
jgi:hypothetical protein